MSTMDGIKTLRKAESPFDREAGLEPGYSVLYPEEYFSGAILLERKRTDRSGRPFTLLLIDLSESGVNESDRPGCSGALASCTRDIDVKGWYATGRVLGVILPDTGGIAAANCVAAKIRQALAGLWGEEGTRQVNISFHFYPGEETGTFDPALYPRERARNGALRAKRLLDLIFSSLGLLALSPLFALVSLLVIATSKGPVFFRQERIGRLGKRFTFLKFRSMYVNGNQKIHEEFINDFIKGKNISKAEVSRSMTRAVYKIERDPRITPVGYFLRKSSLDELPQLINVLRGEMSLIGPRPPLPYECEIYEPWHMRRVEAKPGITGLWQVKGRSRTSFDEMVRLDLKYMREWSLWLDVKILIMTPWAVLTCRGAY